jgi:TonB family protein
MAPLRTLLISVVVSIVCTTALADRLSEEQLHAIGKESAKFVVYAPKPDYPVGARARHFTGSGIVVIRIHVKTGRVVEARIGRSTGHTTLDQAAIRAFSQWRFKPGALKPIGEISPWRHDPFGKEDALLKIPVNFTM